MASRSLSRLGLRLASVRTPNNTLHRVMSVGAGSQKWTQRDLSSVQCQPASGLFNRRFCSSKAAPSSADDVTGNSEKEEHEFQAETRQLLDIVARSLYSEKEVFIRELISNASDAIEKYRYMQVTSVSGQMGVQGAEHQQRSGSIEVTTDKVGGTISIADNGVGMSKEEMVSNLGTIARSGSKAFMAQMKEKGEANPDSIIGQFGVGFYSAFMVADKIEVFSKAEKAGKAHHWVSDGSGKYTIQEVAAESVAPGTKVVIHLKKDCSEFSEENTVRDIIKKYSSFVGSEVQLNGQKSNDLRPVWLMDPKEVEPETHEDFYRYVANAFDKPRFVHHFRTDAPIDIRALLYVPENRPGMFETSREGESGVALYCRKVLIKSKTENIVPKWMRFVKGVVDSEDIPLNLSRELLQDSAQIRKLRTVITNKFLRFLGDKARKEPKSYMEFYKDYGLFFKEGIITSNDQYEKEEIAKLLRFESSAEEPGKMVSITDYCGRMRAGQRDIYYLAAPSRQLAESSPYYESLKRKDVEILFCYESYDELVLMQLQQFNKLKMKSVEKEMREETLDAKEGEGEDEKKAENGLDSNAQDELSNWIQTQLGTKAAKVKVTKKLESHPCVITVEEMAAARHFIKTQGASFTEEQRYNILQPQFEINPHHPIIKKVNDLRSSNPKLAMLVSEQLFANAMVSAGLVEDPRTILRSMNDLLQEALEKH